MAIAVARPFATGTSAVAVVVTPAGAGRKRFMVPIQSTPAMEEIWLHVFSYLPGYDLMANVPFVNKKFHRISFCPRLTPFILREFGFRSDLTKNFQKKEFSTIASAFRNAMKKLCRKNGLMDVFYAVERESDKKLAFANWHTMFRSYIEDNQHFMKPTLFHYCLSKGIHDHQIEEMLEEGFISLEYPEILCCLFDLDEVGYEDFQPFFNECQANFKDFKVRLYDALPYALYCTTNLDLMIERMQELDVVPDARTFEKLCSFPSFELNEKIKTYFAAHDIIPRET